MSLRVRLTLWSTLILAAVFAVFGTLAFFAVNYSLYKAMDDNLQRQTTASVLNFLAHQESDLSRLGNKNQIGAVFYTVIDSSGHILSTDRNSLVFEDLFSQALAGNSPMDTKSLLDGTRVRVLVKPIQNQYTGEIVGVLQAVAPLDIIDQILGGLSLVLVAADLVLLAVAATGSYILTGRTLRVVDNVTRQAHEIELAQDLSRRIAEPQARDELGNLVQTFNRLLSRIEDSFNAQRRFVADSSHELRTPLTVIRSNLHLLRRATRPEEQAELIGITEAEAARLNRMVNNLLYMAQLQAGHDLKPVLRMVELDSLLLDVFARARSMSSVKNQRVSIVHEDIAAALGDRDQLQHLLLNLVDNAIKYTPERGTITLGLWASDGWARIEVGDDGPGIPANDLPLVFKRFYRTTEARQTERNGSGLGLAIVRSIAESHRGRVEVTSKVDEGTTFTLWLPLIGSGEQTAPAADETYSEEEEAVGAASAPANGDQTR